MSKPLIALNHSTNSQRSTRQGYSWTTAFFGFWPAVFRQDWKGLGLGILIAISGFVGAMIIIFMGASAEVEGNYDAAQMLYVVGNLLPLALWLIWANYYNEGHRKRLEADGYTIYSA